MYKLFDLIRAVRAALQPYRVYVQFGDFDGASHQAWTTHDALEWMACYPNDCQVYVFSRGLFRRFNAVVLFRQGCL